MDVTQNGFEKKIYLCFTYNNHFDAIFTKTHRDNLAVIQCKKRKFDNLKEMKFFKNLFYLALVYELLYDKVFGSGDQVVVARKLLRKSDTIYPKEYMKIKEYDEFGYKF